MAEFASDFTNLGAEVCVIAFLTIFERGHVLAAIIALTENGRSIFVHYDLKFFECEGSVVPVEVQDDLQIFNELLVAFIEFEFVSEEAAFCECC